MKIYFVTSSENKKSELASVLGEEYQVIRVDADLPEIQSLNPHEIIREKLETAKLLFPDQLIIVEDTSLEVDALGLLPGPFVKFFEECVDDQGIYRMARGLQPEGELTGRAKVIIGLLNGQAIEFFEGVMEGTFHEQQGEGWGFDRIFIPEGYDQRMGTLGLGAKAKISHRAKAVRSLGVYLESLKR